MRHGNIVTFAVLHDYCIASLFVIKAINILDDVWVIIALQSLSLGLRQMVVIRIEVKL